VVLQAAVPETAKADYRGKALLTFKDVSVNAGAISVAADTAVQVVAYLGDTTGNGAYSGLDGQRIKRVVVGLDTGFAAFPLLDPVLIADATANGSLSGLDATRVLQEVTGIDRAEIPPRPAITIPTPTTADPRVSLPGRWSRPPARHSPCRSRWTPCPRAWRGSRLSFATTRRWWSR